MANNTRTASRKKPKPKKPAKPHADFPLFPHDVGYWAKKVRGKLIYFGKWDDPDAALQKWLDEKDDLLAGRTPRKREAEGLTLKGLCDRFLTEKSHRIDSGELSPRSYADYHAVAQRMCDVLGKDRLATDLAADDFSHLRKEFSRTHGPVRLTKDVTVVRMIFKWGYESALIETPVRFGPNFKPPSKTTRRKARQANGKKDFDADEVRRILDMLDGKEIALNRIDDETGEPARAKQQRNRQLRAMVLLGVNCGFGNTDCASLPLSAVDLDGGWITFPRPKTGVERRCALWPETVAALREVVAKRKSPNDPADADLVFLTKYGNPFVRLHDHEETHKRTPMNAVSSEFGKAMKKLGINRHRGFYSLRHTFETQAGESRDQVAVDRIMGHADSSMAANYRHHISDARLVDVANVVRGWLWPSNSDDRSEA